MPGSGNIEQNPTYRQLMVKGDDGLWYMLPHDCAFGLNTRVEFEKNGRANVDILKCKNVVKEAVVAPVLSYSASAEPVVPAFTGGIAGPSPTPPTPTPSSVAPTPLVTAATPATPVVVAPAPAPPRAMYVITDKKVQADYDAIMGGVAKMNWSGSFGPSIQVGTKLKWQDAACRLLYLKVKYVLHDKSIPSTGLYYYVGSIGINWGKAFSFRISGHTKKAANIKASKTQGVLHIEN